MGGDMLFYVWMDGWVSFGFVLLRFGSWGYNGRNEWRKLIFILRVYKWNFSSVFMLVSFFWFIFFPLVIFDLSNLNLAQHVYSSPS